jgi:hypothetical protein
VSAWVRQFHRWVSIAFTLAVVANFAVMGLGHGQPPPRVTYSPLLPMLLLLFTGLYLFVLLCRQAAAAVVTEATTRRLYWVR